jgi:hypothetical protein
MGFPDERRNLTVLKSLNGNLDKAVEALIRLGEQNPGKSRDPTPTPPPKPDLNGLSFDKTPTASTSSMNPFDALDAVAPLPSQAQQAQQPPPLQTQLPYAGPLSAPPSAVPSNPYNPFLAQQSISQQQIYPQSQQNFGQQQNPFGQQQQNPFGQQQQQNLEQSFQGLQLSNQQSQQPLFPNRTGGYGQPQLSHNPQTNPFQHSFTPPPMPQVPQQYASFYQTQNGQSQSLASPTSPGNPFLKSVKSQIFAPTNNSYNPFNQAPSQAQFQQAQPQQQQQQPQAQYQPQQGSNPFMTQSQQFATQSQAPNQWHGQQSSQQGQQLAGSQQAPYQLQQQQTSGFDKNSILALYNYPQLAPQRSEPVSSTAAPAVASPPAAPAPGSMNPFAASQASSQNQQQPGPPQQSAKHASNESVDFAGLMGGRHSPDAFSGLSASFRR